MFGLISDECFNDESTLLVLNHNSVAHKNFGRCADIAKKYPYADVAGLRKPDKYLKSYAVARDWDEEGSSIMKTPPSYTTGPAVATLITQFGIGSAFEVNDVAQKIAKNSRNKDLVNRLVRDSQKRRNLMFNQSIFRLGLQMASPDRDYIDKIVIPSGIGRSGIVDDVWLMVYLPVIHRFARDMESLGKTVIVIVPKSVKLALDKQYHNRDDVIRHHYNSLFVQAPMFSFVNGDVILTDMKNLDCEDLGIGEDVPDTLHIIDV